MNGIDSGIPATDVARSQSEVFTAHFGWKVMVPVALGNLAVVGVIGALGG